jgi:hypothetical protein
MIQFDLSVPCPHCLTKIQPAEQQRLDSHGKMLCPCCGRTFNSEDVLREIRLSQGYFR